MKNARSPQEIDAYVGHKLKQIRLASGISQTELAEAAGVTFQQLQKYEEGANRVSIGRLYSLAKTLDVPLDYFVDGFKARGRRKNPPRNRQLIDKVLLDRKAMQLLQYYHRTDETMRRHIYEIVKKIAGEK